LEFVARASASEARDGLSPRMALSRQRAISVVSKLP
jgi:hypothetical protein